MTKIKILLSDKRSDGFLNGCIYSEEAIKSATEFPCWKCKYAPKAACIIRLKKLDGIHIEDERIGLGPDFWGR